MVVGSRKAPVGQSGVCAERGGIRRESGQTLLMTATDCLIYPNCRNLTRLPPICHLLGSCHDLRGYVDASAARPSRSNLQHALMCPTRAARTLDCSQPSVRGRRVAQPRVQAVSRARRLRRAPLPTSLSRCDVTSMARKLIQRK